MSQRLVWFGIVAGALWFFGAPRAAVLVFAQEEKDTAPAGRAAEQPGAGTMQDTEEEDMEDTTGPDQNAATPRQPTEAVQPQEHYLSWMIRSSGPIGLVLFFMSFLAVGLSIKFLLELRRDKIIPPQLVAAFDTRIKERRYQEAYDLAKNDSSYLGKVLAAGMSRISIGYAQALEAMQEVGEDESMRIEHRLSWLAILGTIGPLLGLVGTVEGIIASFRVIATSETQPKPSLLAAGISTSLFNTFEGLLVAIFATVAFMLLKNQAARIVLEVGMTTGNLMSKFSGMGRQSRGGTPAAAEQG